MGTDAPVVEETKPVAKPLQQPDPAVDDTQRQNAVDVTDATGTSTTAGARVNLSTDSQDVSASRSQATAELARLIDAEQHLPGLRLDGTTAGIHRDAQGQIDQVTDAKGNVFKFGRDANGTITSFTDKDGKEYKSTNGFNFVNGEGKKLDGVFAIDEKSGAIHFLGNEGHFEWRPNGDILIAPNAPPADDRSTGLGQAEQPQIPLDQRMQNAASALGEIMKGLDQGGFKAWLTESDDKLSDTALAIIKDNRGNLDDLRAAYKKQHPDGDLDKDLLSKVTGPAHDRLAKLLGTKDEYEFAAWDVTSALDKIHRSEKDYGYGDVHHDEAERASAERILRETINGMTPEQIAKLDEAFKKANNGRTLSEAFATDPHITDATKAALKIELSSASPDEKSTQLGQLALQNKSLEMFKEAFRNASPAAREAFKEQYGEQLAKTFKGSQLDQAQQYLNNGELSLATRIRENTMQVPLIGPWTNQGAVDHLLDSMSAQQHIDYIAGANLQDKTTGLTPEQQRQKDFYKDVSEALKASGDAKDQAKWNDKIMNGGSLVSKVIDSAGQSKDALYSAIENMNQADFKRLHDPNNPQFRKQVEDALGTVLSGAELQKAKDLLDKQVKATEYGKNEKRGVMETLKDAAAVGGIQDGSRVLQILSEMSPTEQEKYRNDPAFKKQLQDTVHQALDPERQPGPMWDIFKQNSMVADRLFSKLDQPGGKPELGAAERVIIAAGRDTSRVQVLNDIAQAYKDEPGLKERINNPKTAEDRELKKAFETAFERNVTNAAPQGSADDYRSVLTDGTLRLDQKLALQDEYQGKLAELVRASAEEKKLLLDADPSHTDAAQLRAKAFAGMTPEQQALAEKALAQDKLRPEDTMRAFILGNSGIKPEQIKSMLSGMTPAEIEAAKIRYEQTYKHPLLQDLLPQMPKEQFADVEKRLTRPLTPREMVADIVARDEASKTGLAGMLAQVKDGTTMQSGEATGTFLKTVQDSEAFKNMTPDMQAKVREYLETSFAQQRATKQEISDIAINAAIIGASVAAAPFTGGESLLAVTATATTFGAIGAVAQTVGKQAMMGADYDPSTRWRDAARGFTEGATGALGVPGLKLAGNGGYIIKATADGAYSGAISSAASGALEWRFDQTWEENVARISALTIEGTQQGATSGAGFAIGFAGVIQGVSKIASLSHPRLDGSHTSPIDVRPPADLPPGGRPEIPKPPLNPDTSAWGSLHLDNGGGVTAITARDGVYTFDKSANVFRNDKGETISNFNRQSDGTVTYTVDKDKAQVRIDGATKTVVESRQSQQNNTVTETTYAPGSRTETSVVMYRTDGAGNKTPLQSFTNQNGTWVNAKGEAVGTKLEVMQTGLIMIQGKPEGANLGTPHVGQNLDRNGGNVEATRVVVRPNGEVAAFVDGLPDGGFVRYDFNDKGQITGFAGPRVEATFEYDGTSGDAPSKVSVKTREYDQTETTATYTRRASDGVYVDAWGIEVAKSIEASGTAVRFKPTDTYRYPGEELANKPIAEMEIRADGSRWRSYANPRENPDVLVPRDQKTPSYDREKNWAERKTDFTKPETDGQGNVTYVEQLGDSRVVRDADGNVLAVRNADGTEVRWQGKDRSTLDSIEYWKEGKLEYSVQKNGDKFERVYPDGHHEAIEINGRPVDRIAMNNDGAVTMYATFEKTAPDGSKYKSWEAERTGPDGVKVRIDENQRERISAEDYDKAKSRFNELSQRFSDTDKNRKLRIDNLMQEWETNATRNGVSKEQIANVYASLNKMLSTDDALLSMVERERLVEQFALSLAHNDFIDQGFWNTCNVTASHEVRGMVNNPDVMADLLAQVSTTGRYITQDGHIIDMKESVGTMVPQGRDAAKRLDTKPVSDPNNFDDLTQHTDTDDTQHGGRSFSDQIIQSTLVNVYWQQQTSFKGNPGEFRPAMTVDQLRQGQPYHPADLRYEIGTVTKPNEQSPRTVENITNYSKNPPEALLEDRWVNGLDLLDPTVQRPGYAEQVTNGPALSYDALRDLDKYLYGPKANTDYLLTNDMFPQQADLLSRLQGAQNKQPPVYPITIAVDSGAHVVNVHDVFKDPTTGEWMVYVTNQWGAKHDRLEKEPMKLSELWDWMHREAPLRGPNDGSALTTVAPPIETPNASSMQVNPRAISPIKDNITAIRQFDAIKTEPAAKEALDRYEQMSKLFPNGLPDSEKSLVNALTKQGAMKATDLATYLNYAADRLAAQAALRQINTSGGTFRNNLENELKIDAVQLLKIKGNSAAVAEARQLRIITELLVPGNKFEGSQSATELKSLLVSDFQQALRRANDYAAKAQEQLRNVAPPTEEQLRKDAERSALNAEVQKAINAPGYEARRAQQLEEAKNQPKPESKTFEELKASVKPADLPKLEAQIADFEARAQSREKGPLPADQLERAKSMLAVAFTSNDDAYKAKVNQLLDGVISGRFRLTDGTPSGQLTARPGATTGTDVPKPENPAKRTAACVAATSAEIINSGLGATTQPIDLILAPPVYQFEKRTPFQTEDVPVFDGKPMATAEHVMAAFGDVTGTIPGSNTVTNAADYIKRATGTPLGDMMRPGKQNIPDGFYFVHTRIDPEKWQDGDQGHATFGEVRDGILYIRDPLNNSVNVVDLRKVAPNQDLTFNSDKPALDGLLGLTPIPALKNK